MTSKERVFAAIHHTEPDRVPLDLWALSSVMTNLRAYFGVDNDEEVRQALGIDLRSVWPAYSGPSLDTFDDGSFMDWWGVRKKQLGAFEDAVTVPLADAQTLADIEAYAWPDPEWFDYQAMRAMCETLSDDYALVVRDSGPYGTCVLREAMILRGMEQFMLDMVTNPEIARAIIMAIEKFYLELNRRILEVVGDLTTIYFIGDDVGTQDSLMIGPRMFRKFIAPSLQRFAAQGKQYKQVVMYHTCGAVRKLIPDFLDMGVDILNPIQPSARNMDIAALKREFGETLCFHGALDILSILSTGTPEKVRAEVKRLFDILGVGGGFILSPTNNIMPETPVENIIAMYETAETIGRYREIC